jgi:hypothetical protein
MKYYVLALHSLLVVNVYSMDKQLTIRNNNIPELRTSFTWRSLGQFIVCKENGDNDMKAGESKTINMDQRPGFIQTTTLYIKEAVPNEVILHPSENGKLTFNDVITIKQNNDKTFTIANQNNLININLAHMTIPIFIGSPENNFTITDYIPSRQIKIHNKNLFQIIVTTQALRRTSQIFSNIDWDNDFSTIIDNDPILESKSYTLRENEARTITTYSSDLNPEMIEAATILTIPQAAQPKVFIRINKGEIKSGDTLEIGISPYSNKICITKISPLCTIVLAELYSQKLPSSGLTIY